MGLNAAASHCPTCLAEYRAGFDTCSDDGTRLIPGPAPVTKEHAPEEARHHARDTDDRLVALCSVRQTDADLLVAKLRSEGLRAFADDRYRAFLYSDVVPELALCRVWVCQSELAAAREIATRALSGEDAI